MRNRSNDLQLVILQSPYETWNDSKTYAAFYDMVRLKRLGYGANYPAGVLPVDTTDLIATHVLLYERVPGAESARLIMGFKSTTLATCRAYNLTFPGLALPRAANAPNHSAAVEEIISHCESEKKGLAYLGSWTIDPILKRRPDLREAAKEIFISSYCRLYEEQGVSDVIIGGTLRFHTDVLFSKLGHRPLSWRGKALPTINVAHLAGEEVLMMHMSKFNESLRPVVKKWVQLWEARQIVAEQGASETKFAA